MPAADIRLEVAASPHLVGMGTSTAGMMRDVLIALLPVVGFAVWRFGRAALVPVAAGVAMCVAAEAGGHALRGRAGSVRDGSAALTGLLLALSLPPAVPLHVVLVGSLAAIGLGKIVFGGLGYNLFNPAMVGRAFVSAAFPAAMGAGACVDGVTGSTPLSAAKLGGDLPGLWDLAAGTCTGCLGEVSALACLAGGLYLVLRRSAAWQIPAAMIGVVVLCSLVRRGPGLEASWTWAHDLSSGALLFGACFIATDPVTSPVSHTGRLVFGAGAGLLVYFFRTFSGYPEGVMFAVLLMNAATPLINQFTTPVPIGGRPP